MKNTTPQTLSTSLIDILNGNRPELLRNINQPIVYDLTHNCDVIGCNKRATFYRQSIFKHGASIYTCSKHTPDFAKTVQVAGYFTVHAL